MFSRGFVVLFIAMLTAMVGISMVAPLLPIYVREELGGPEIAVALSFSGISILMLIGAPIAGRLGDRYGPKPLIAVGFLVYAASGLGFVFADTWQLVVAFRMLSGVGGAAFFPMTMAYIGRLAPIGREGQLMGIFAVAEVAGFGAGPLFGGVVRDLASADVAFLVMAIMLFATAILVATQLPGLPPEPAGEGDAPSDAPEVIETPVPPAVRPPGRQAHLRMARLLDPLDIRGSLADLGQPLKLPAVQAALSVQTTVALGWGAGATFLTVYVVSEDGLGTESAAFAGTLLAARSLIGGMLQPLSGRLADRHSRLVLIVLGLVVAGTGQFIVPDLPGHTIGTPGNGFVVLPALLVTYFVVGLGEAIVWPAQRAIFVEVGRSAGMGAVMGLNQMGGSLGFLSGSLLGALVVSLFGLEASFRFTGVVVLAGALLFVVLMRRAGLGAPGASGTPSSPRQPVAAGVGLVE